MDDCHSQDVPSDEALGFNLRLGAVAATYQSARAEGDYQGLTLGFEALWPGVRLGASLPAYRLLRNGVELYGPGDVLLSAEATFAETWTRSLLFGVALSTSLPTGSSEDDLGMGHLMAMPNFWLGTELGPFSAKMSLGYGLAVGGGSDHAGHSGLQPLVAPMNPSEVELSLSASLRTLEFLDLGGGVFFASPVAMEGGQSRGTAYGSLTFFPRSRVDVRVEGHGPLIGDAFQAKGRLTVGLKF